MDQKCISEGIKSLVEIAKIPGSDLVVATASMITTLRVTCRALAAPSRFALERNQKAAQDPSRAEELLLPISRFRQEEVMQLLEQVNRGATAVVDCAELGIAYEKKARGWGWSAALWNGVARLGIGDTSLQRQGKLEAMRNQAMNTRTFVCTCIQEIMEHGLAMRTLFPQLFDIDQAQRLHALVKEMKESVEEFV